MTRWNLRRKVARWLDPEGARLADRAAELEMENEWLRTVLQRWGISPGRVWALRGEA